MDVVARIMAQGPLRSKVQPEPWPLYLLPKVMLTPQFHEEKTEAQRLVQGQAQNCFPIHGPFRDVALSGLLLSKPEEPPVLLSLLSSNT